VDIIEAVLKWDLIKRCCISSILFHVKAKREGETLLSSSSIA